jgi:hypothetical protein
VDADRVPPSKPAAALLAVLQNLPATGEDGFEGLLRDAVGCVARQRLSLVKSGPQGGFDAGTRPDDPGPQIVVEAKRYGGGTKLHIGELQAKLVEALDKRPNLDIMVFGATQEIKHDDQRTLTQKADSEGVGLVFIDWQSNVPVQQLAVLCALAPQAVRERVDASQRPDIDVALAQIREHADFPAASEALSARLQRPDMGWEMARKAAVQWLCEAMSSRSTALAKLSSQANNVLDPQANRVGRPRYDPALDGWMANPSQPLALLGDEGVGKSWVALSWWHARCGADGRGLPLTLVIPARDVGSEDIGDLVARLLAARMGCKDTAFWRRRLDLWLKAPDSDLHLLLIFDGLNENFSFRGWPQLLATLAVEPWGRKVATLLTCRQSYWRNTLHDLMGAVQPPVTVPIAPFNDAELDAAIAANGLGRDDFAPALRPLLRIPRLCRLAIQHRQALHDSGDITPERLIYEDWKDRLVLRSHQIPVTDHQFRAFVAGLGHRMRDTALSGTLADIALPLGQLGVALGTDHGHSLDDLRHALSEIIDGRWMTSTPADPTRFCLVPELVPFALGLALVDRLRREPPSGVEEALAQFVEPLGEQDRVVRLLRAAATVACVEAECPPAVREAVLRAWFQRQNFGDEDFEAFWRLVPCSIESFLDLAEWAWLHQIGGAHDDWTLIFGLANATERWTNLCPTLLDWCGRWLATYWPDPVNGAVLGYDVSDPDIAVRMQNTKARRAAWDGITAKRGRTALVREWTEDGVPWLACRVIGLLSHIEGQILAPILAGWAISRAIMDHATDFDQIAWLVRLWQNAEAQTPAILTTADQLAALAQPVPVKAARLLYAALATPEAMRRAEKLPPEPTRDWPHSPSSVVVDEQTGVVAWAPGAETAMPDETLWRVGELFGLALNPRLTLAPAATAVIRALVDSQPTNVDLWQAEPALARWAPRELANLYRRLVASLEECDDERRRYLGYRIRTIQFIIDDSARDRFRLAALRLNGGTSRLKYANVHFRTAAMVGRTAGEQIDILKDVPDGPDFNSSRRYVLAAPTADDIAAILVELVPDAPVSRLTGWLAYLALAPDVQLPPHCEPVLDLVGHDDAKVRLWALRAAERCIGPGVETTAWRWRANMAPWEAARGSCALVHAADRLPAHELRSRIEPPALGLLVTREGAAVDDMDAFAEVVRARIAQDFGSGPRERPFPEHHYNLKRPLDELVRDRAETVLEWLTPLHSGIGRSVSFFHDSYPYIHLCAALMQHRPSEGAKMWAALWTHYEGGIVTNDTLRFMPFSVDNDEAERLRADVLRSIKNDVDLVTLAACALRNGGEGWIVRQVRDDLAATSAGQIARGLWLAGLLDTTPAAEALWANELAQPPAPGWLSQVHGRAAILYRHNRWARHWAEAFFAEPNRDRAYGYHLLFTTLVDRRAYHWAPKFADDAWQGLSADWRAHWSLAWPQVRQTIDEKERRWRDQLFGDKVAGHVQRPWH